MSNFPKKIRISKKTIPFCVLFTLFACIITYGVYFICAHTVLIEDGVPMPAGEKSFFVTVEIVVGLGIWKLVLSLWKRILTGTEAMVLTEAGVENTFIIIGVLAFWTTVNIRFIPWSALIPNRPGTGAYKINTDKLPSDMGKVKKSLLGLFGLSFGIGSISAEEVEDCRRAALSAKDRKNGQEER